MKTHSRWRLGLLGLIVAAASAIPLTAGTFIVSPVRIELSRKRPYTIVQVSNQSEESKQIQAHVVSWRLQANQEVYSQTDVVLLNPPIFTLGPRGKQFIRLGFLRPSREEGEATYRLILEEVPRPAVPGFTGLRTVLRISIPIFYNVGAPAAPRVNWAARPTSSGLEIVATNHGGAHVQIRSLNIAEEGSNGTSLHRFVSEYLLPGQYRTWLIDDDRFRAASRVKLVAATDAGELHALLEPKTE